MDSQTESQILKCFGATTLILSLYYDTVKCQISHFPKVDFVDIAVVTQQRSLRSNICNLFLYKCFYFVVFSFRRLTPG